MTPKEIADCLRAAKTLTGPALDALEVYIQDKRATGAPMNLEYSIRVAAVNVDCAVESLQEHIESLRRDLDGLSSLAANGAQFKARNHVLSQRKPTEFYLSELAGKQAHLNTLLDLWVGLADRIVATDEDRAAYAAKRRQFNTKEAIARLREALENGEYTFSSKIESALLDVEALL